jgi:hypothetical protein
MVQIVERCLEKKRDKRFSTVTELSEALQAFLEQSRENGTRSSGLAAIPLVSSSRTNAASLRSSLGQALVLPTLGASESTGEEFLDAEEVAGLPRRRNGLRWLLVFVITASVAIVLWLWAAGKVVALPFVESFQPLGSTSEAPSGEVQGNWQPPAGPLVEIEYPLERRAAAVVEGVEAGEPDAADEAAESEPADAPEATDETPAKPTEVVPERSLTAEQRQRRYQQWLEEQKLTPVDEVMVEESP